MRLATVWLSVDQFTVDLMFGQALHLLWRDQVSSNLEKEMRKKKMEYIQPLFTKCE